MKCFLIRDSPNEMRQSSINISGLKVLKGGDEPRAQSPPHNDSVRPVRHSSFPSWAEFDIRSATAVAGRGRGSWHALPSPGHTLVGSRSATAGRARPWPLALRAAGSIGMAPPDWGSVGPILTWALSSTSNLATTSCGGPESARAAGKGRTRDGAMSALARGHDHPPGVTTFSLVRSSMDTMRAQGVHASRVLRHAPSEYGCPVMEGGAVSVGGVSKEP
jgi:hypothetical protein